MSRQHVALVPFEPAHVTAITTLATAVGWPHRRDDIELMTSFGCGLSAVADGEVVGSGFRWDFPDLSRIGLVIVDPAMQGMGLGRRIVERLIADPPNGTLALLATDQGRPLYDSLGFVEIGRVQQHQGIRVSAPGPPERARPARASDVEAIVTLDGAAFGADRREWTSKLVATSSAVVADGPSGIGGFGLARSFGRGAVVGPIVAPDQETAIDLFDALPTTGFSRVDSSLDAELFNAHLSSCGLTPTGESSPTMVRGGRPTVGEGPMMIALSGHGLG